MELIIGQTQEIISLAREIRHDVFTVEQGIPSLLDHDGRDDRAFHALMSDDGRPVATARLYSVDGKHGIMARIAVVKDYRGRGVAGRVVRAMIEYARNYGLASIEIHAHQYLRSFYEKLGFLYVQDGESVAGYQLIEMLYRLDEKSLNSPLSQGEGK